MANLTTFLIEQTGAKRACLWAHDAHVSKEPNSAMLGSHLSLAPLHYYAIGFYIYRGSARAWDLATKIGVISHQIPIAPDYTVEHVIMNAHEMPEIAWVSLRRIPAWLTKWLDTPRYVRELGAIYQGDDAMMVLRDMRAAFDGIAVIQIGHDSSPTPTGIRTAKH